MKKIWFLSQNEMVTGPFSTEEIHQSIDEHRVSSNSLVWGQTLSGWVSLGEWKAHALQIYNSSKPEKSETWYYSYDNEKHGPLSRQHLIVRLGKLENIKKALIWCQGMPNWLSIFEFHDLMEELNLNRREFPRAPILGEVSLIHKDEEIARCNLVSVSEGGIGVQPALFLNSGETVLISIKSEQLPSHMKVRCEVRYISPSGHAGLQFLNISSEFKSNIIQYVEKFQKPQLSSDDSAA